MQRILLTFLSLITYFLLLNSPAFAVEPESTNYKLVEYGFGAGGVASSSSTNYFMMGLLGEVNIASMSSANYSAESGLVFALKANVPPAPTVTNPATNYDRLKIVINTGGNPTDATYALEISTDNFASDIKYIKSNKTIGNNLIISDFQTNTTWGATGFFVSGLMPHTTYYIRVNTRTGNSTESEFGPSAIGTTSDPTLTFGMDTSSITFNNLNDANSYTDSSKTTVLTTSTNAYNGYVIYAIETQPLTAAPSVTIDDYGSPNSAPTTWTGNGFGYNTDDADLQTGPGLANRFAGSKYAGFSSLSQDPVADHTAYVEEPTVVSETFNIAYHVTASDTTTVGNYQNTIIYTIVPIY